MKVGYGAGLYIVQAVLKQVNLLNVGVEQGKDEK